MKNIRHKQYWHMNSNDWDFRNSRGSVYRFTGHRLSKPDHHKLSMQHHQYFVLNTLEYVRQPPKQKHFNIGDTVFVVCSHGINHKLSVQKGKVTSYYTPQDSPYKQQLYVEYFINGIDVSLFIDSRGCVDSYDRCMFRTRKEAEYWSRKFCLYRQ